MPNASPRAVTAILPLLVMAIGLSVIRFRTSMPRAPPPVTVRAPLLSMVIGLPARLVNASMPKAKMATGGVVVDTISPLFTMLTGLLAPALDPRMPLENVRPVAFDIGAVHDAERARVAIGLYDDAIAGASR